MQIIAIFKLLASLAPYIPVIMKSWDMIEGFLKNLKDTPEEHRVKLLQKVLAASTLARESGGDTSKYEDIIHRGKPS